MIESQTVTIIISALAGTAFIILKIIPSILRIRRELKNEKGEAERLAAMTPEEIAVKEGVDIKQKVRILPVLGFVLSVASLLLFPLISLYLDSTWGLEGSVWEMAVIMSGIAIGLTVAIIGFITFYKDVALMRTKELRGIGERAKAGKYYRDVFKKSVLVVIGVSAVILFLVYFGVK